MRIQGSKSCPHCGRRLTKRELWQWRKPLTACSGCGRELSVNLTRMVLPGILGSPIAAAIIAAGLLVDRRWWLLIPVGMLLQFGLHCWMMGIMEPKEGRSPQRGFEG